MEDDVTKLRSCATLNTFYHETQQEIANLGKQILSRDGIISDLKARLTKYERTRVTVEGEEPCLVGPSKSLVESLCRENFILTQKLKETEVDSAQKLEASKRVSNLLPFFFFCTITVSHHTTVLQMFLIFEWNHQGCLYF